MGDLISRQAALRQKFKSYYTNGAEIKQIEAVPVREIEKLPAVDAIPVVRCRDCEHKDRESGFCHGRGWPMQLVPDDGFCDKGAVNRRTDGTAEKTEKTV
jgi:hypothetical protein